MDLGAVEAFKIQPWVGETGKKSKEENFLWMNNLPRQKLCEIITQYGRSVCEDPLRCETLLWDLCGEYRREIFVLICALKEQVPTDLLTPQTSIPFDVVLVRLTKRLQDNFALSEEAAYWAVESWALALGVIQNSVMLSKGAISYGAIGGAVCLGIFGAIVGAIGGALSGAISGAMAGASYGSGWTTPFAISLAIFWGILKALAGALGDALQLMLVGGLMGMVIGVVREINSLKGNKP